MSGTLVISLDFELHWGGFEKRPIGQWAAYYDRTRAMIPQLLSLFAEHRIAATWATVGLLMHSSREALQAHTPAMQPTYEEAHLSPYHYMQQVGIGLDEAEDPYHYAASLLQQIQATPKQEIGTHTFGHYYCNEPSQTVEQFREDIRAAKLAAAAWDIKLRSLVFPRNQFNKTYLQVCREEGILTVRSNPDRWFWLIDTKEEPLMKRLARGWDAYQPFGKAPNRYRWDELQWSEGVLLQPSSRVLRQYDPRERFLHSWKLQRILREMEAAAREDTIYHLWWHPHNFGHHPAENLAFIDTLCRHANRLGMQTLSMGGVLDRTGVR